MDVDTIVTACNVASLFVLVGTALAAVVQFRHVRTGNELQAVLAIERDFTAAELQAALIYVQDELPVRLNDPGYRAELIARGYVDPRAHPETIACNWFNAIGTLVAGGFVNETLVLTSFGRLIEYYWELLAPAVALMRCERGDEQYARFEFLAGRASLRRTTLEASIFPAGARRMPLVDAWLAVDAEQNGTVPAP